MKVKITSPEGNPRQTRIEDEKGNRLGLVQSVTWEITAEKRATVTLKRAYLPPAAEVSASPSGEVKLDTLTAESIGTTIFEFELPDEVVERFGRTRKSVLED